MKKRPSVTDDPAELRRSAEQRLATRTVTAATPSDEKRLIHELQVHQIELEMLNENLRHAQAELEKSWACFFDLYELAPVGYLTVNDRDIIQNANLTATKLLGIDRNALLKMPLPRFILPEDQDQYYICRKHIEETGAPQTCELQALRHDGQIVWLKVEMNQLVEANGAPELRVVLIDISDLKQKESDLRESEERLDLALAGSGLAIWDWKIAEHSVTAGKRWFEMLGYTEDELGTEEAIWKDLINPKDLESLQRRLSSHLQGDTTHFESEYQVRHKHGHWVSVEAKGKVTRRDKDHTPLRMVGTILDISQRKRLHEEGIDLLNRIEALIHESCSPAPVKSDDINLVDSLTKRELQILGMIAQGMSSAEIAKRLHLSIFTVSSHRQNLMAKLDLHSAAEVTRFAISQGLLAQSK